MYEQSCRGKSSFHVEFGVSPLYSTMSGMCEELVVVAAVVAAVVVVVVVVVVVLFGQRAHSGWGLAVCGFLGHASFACLQAGMGKYIFD